MRQAAVLSTCLLLGACDGRPDESPVGVELAGERPLACGARALSPEESARVANLRLHDPGGPPLVVFLNRDGGAYTAGADDSASGRSSLLTGPVELPAYEGTGEAWDALLRCVRVRFEAFNVHLTDTRPAGPHVELVVGGHPGHVGRSGVSGMAPHDTQGCGQLDRAVGFVFSANLGGPEQLCAVATHQLGHLLSLEHAALCDDPMAARPGCGYADFPDATGMCGAALPEECACRDGWQNPVDALGRVVGLHAGGAPLDLRLDDTPPVIEVSSPEDGAHVALTRPLTVRASVRDETMLARVELVWARNGVAFPCPVRTSQVSCTRAGDRFEWVVEAGAGPRAFHVRAVDRAGHETLSDGRTVFFTPDGGPPAADEDASPPVVQVLRPEAEVQVPAGAPLVVEASVTDDGEVAGVELWWGFTGDLVPCPARTTYADCVVDGDTRRWTVRVDLPGPRTFDVRARDGAGRVSSSGPRTVTVTPRVPPPDAEPGPPSTA